MTPWFLMIWFLMEPATLQIGPFPNLQSCIAAEAAIKARPEFADGVATLCVQLNPGQRVEHGVQMASKWHPRRPI